ncbi:sigma-B regulation protein RsbU (phosphoserine phosphatase) [Sphingomonas sp. SORGH_AS870]|nr:sigma-B regulation protein RsbU (phosphoserine phosphatase) [Sphingomonas sp. SORGH_AS_0870]
MGAPRKVENSMNSARILLVDDSAEARDAGMLALATGGFARVEGANDANHAYDLLGIDDGPAPPAFDCILLDILMPGVDGIEACAAIRSSGRYRDVPIIMVSGQNDVSSLNQSFVAGANDYVTKPFRPIDLLARTRAALRFKREIDRRRAREKALRDKTIVQEELRGFLPDMLIANRSLLDAELRLAADNGVDTTLCALQVRALDPYRLEHGAAAATRLMRQLSMALCDVAAPMGAVLGLFDDGLFLSIAPNVDPTGMVAFGEAALTRIDAMKLPHGASARDLHVALDAVVDMASGDRLLLLPGEMITLLEQQQRRRPFLPLPDMDVL